MTSSPTWEQWDGHGYPAERLNSVIYYYPGKTDIEEPEQRDKLAVEIHRDGVAPTKHTAHLVLEDAVVMHGQVEHILSELWFYSGSSFDGNCHEVMDATWVEIDEYED